ncbi:MAG: BamA/TamA family outer membrane protein [Bacteroidales bacterium]
MIKHLLFLLTLLFIFPALLFSNPADSSKTINNNGIGKNSSIIVPVAFYQEETSVGVGLMGGYYFTRDRVNMVSNIQGMLIYTRKKQVKFSLLPKIYSLNRKYYLSGHLRLSHYPDKFWGVGSETEDWQEEDFTFREASFLMQLQRHVTPSFLLGFQAGYERGEVYEMQTDGAIALENPVGTEPYSMPGIGIVGTWDTRDNLFFATRGEFLKISALGSHSSFGSTLNNLWVKLDSRIFREIVPEHIVAGRFLSHLTWGDIPFQKLPSLGGNEVLRGFYQGRYRDQTLFTAIAEYRFPIYWRFRGAVFANAANVGPTVKDFNLLATKMSAGAGLRFRVNDARMHIRFDVGVTPTGRMAIYFSANEAF